MSNYRAKLISSCVLLAAGGGHVTPVTAQQPGVQAGIEEVIVTARRREESLQETPVAISVLSSGLLDQYGITGVNSIAQITPGFQTSEASGSVGGTIVLRGIGSGDSQPFIDQAVSLNVDGVQISSAQLLRAAQMDLKQIELLRGPQVLFFGKNSPGGIISITSADPGEELEFLARLGYEYENEETYGELMASGPLSETVGGRIFARFSDMDGYMDVASPPIGPFPPSTLPGYPDKEEMFLRGTLSFVPSEALSIRLKGTYTDTEINGGPSHFSDVTDCAYDQPQETPTIPDNCKNDAKIYTSQLPKDFLALYPLMGSNPNGQRDNEQMLFSGIVDYDLTEGVTLTSVTGYYDVDEYIVSNGSYGLGLNPSLGFAVDFSLEQWSQEFRLVSDTDSRLNYALGGLYEHRKLYTETFIGVPIILFPLPVESTNQTHETYSAFGQLLWDITDRMELTVGGRYTRETKDLDDFTVNNLLTGVIGDATEDPRYPRTELKFNDFSPEVTLSYRPKDDLMYFLSYKQGFKSGGFDAGFTNGAILTNPALGQEFDPEEVEGFEGGLKSTLLDSQLVFNLTAYWYEYDDLQVPTFDTNNTTFRTRNAAKARIQGLELESNYVPEKIPGLSFRLSAAYNDSEYKKYLADCYAGQSQALGCNQVLNPGTGLYTSQDLSGESLRKAPDFSAILGAYYEFPITGDLMMSLSGNLSYSDGYDAGTAYQPLAYQSSFTKFDASLRLFSASNGWEIALIGRNLSDELNIVNGIDRSQTGGAKGSTSTCSSLTETGCELLADILGTPVQPRTVAVQFTYRYR